MPAVYCGGKNQEILITNTKTIVFYKEFDKTVNHRNDILENHLGLSCDKIICADLHFPIFYLIFTTLLKIPIKSQNEFRKKLILLTPTTPVNEQQKS